MKGININCKNKDWIEEIFNGKWVETRCCKKNNENIGSLHSYLGERVGLIETGNGKAILRGFATINSIFCYRTEEEFKSHEWAHRVYKWDEYYWDGRIKYGYGLEDIVRCEPRIITTRGNVAREIKEE